MSGKVFFKLLLFFLIFVNIGFFILAKMNFQPLKDILVGAYQTQNYGETEISLYEIADIPILKDGESDNLAEFLNSSSSFLVFDRNSETILFSQNADQTFYPASTTKLMTALVVLDIYDLDDVITIKSSDLKFGNSLGFFGGEKLKTIDLLKAMLIESSNEAAYILAKHSNLANGYDDFIDLMNQKTNQLGLDNTVFANPTGLDDLNQKTTALELLKLTQFFLENDLLRDIVSQEKTSITDLEGTKTHYLYNTNKLLDNETFFGVKTGTTGLAAQVLVSLVKHQQKELIIVVLKSKDRYNDTTNLFEKTFDSYQWVSY